MVASPRAAATCRARCIVCRPLSALAAHRQRTRHRRSRGGNRAACAPSRSTAARCRHVDSAVVSATGRRTATAAVHTTGLAAAACLFHRRHCQRRRPSPLRRARCCSRATTSPRCHQSASVLLSAATRRESACAAAKRANSAPLCCRSTKRTRHARQPCRRPHRARMRHARRASCERGQRASSAPPTRLQWSSALWMAWRASSGARIDLAIDLARAAEAISVAGGAAVVTGVAAAAASVFSAAALVTRASRVPRPAPSGASTPLSRSAARSCAVVMWRARCTGAERVLPDVRIELGLPDIRSELGLPDIRSELGLPDVRSELVQLALRRLGKLEVRLVLLEVRFGKLDMMLLRPLPRLLRCCACAWVHHRCIDVCSETARASRTLPLTSTARTRSRRQRARAARH